MSASVQILTRYHRLVSIFSRPTASKHAESFHVFIGPSRDVTDIPSPTGGTYANQGPPIISSTTLLTNEICIPELDIRSAQVVITRSDHWPQTLAHLEQKRTLSLLVRYTKTLTDARRSPAARGLASLHLLLFVFQRRGAVCIPRTRGRPTRTAFLSSATATPSSARVGNFLLLTTSTN